MKYFIWLVVLLAVVVWLNRFKKRIVTNAQKASQAHNPTAGVSPQRADDAESMVQCAQCGIHFPASEAVTNASGTVFCSTEHRMAAA